jgi:Beta-lactamase enzyme family
MGHHNRFGGARRRGVTVALVGAPALVGLGLLGTTVPAQAAPAGAPTRVSASAAALAASLARQAAPRVKAADAADVSNGTTVDGGSVYPFGAAPNLGDLSTMTLGAPIEGIASTPNGQGYWEVSADGGVYAFGDAGYFGSASSLNLNQPIVGMAATPDGHGYWLVSADGGIYSYGDAGFFGSTGNLTLNQPIVGMAATPDGHGYWLVAADGGIFSFGDAKFFGSTGNLTLNQPIVGMAAAPGGQGYWLVAADGGIFSFGDAPFLGSTGGIALTEPITGMAASSDGHGYSLVAADGGIFSFGDAPFYGSAAGQPLTQHVIGMARTAGGYWLATGGGAKDPFSGSLLPYLGAMPQINTAAVEDLNTGQTFTYNPGPQLELASTVKPEILGTLLWEHQATGQPLSTAEQVEATGMIEISDNTDGQDLFDDVGGAAAVQDFDDTIGMTNTTVFANWGASTTTPVDQLKVLAVYAVANPTLNDASRAYGLSLLGNVEPSQIFGINTGIDPSTLKEAKTGRIPADGVRNGIGWIDGDGRDYLIAVFVQDGASDQAGEAAMEPISFDSWVDLNP